MEKEFKIELEKEYSFTIARSVNDQETYIKLGKDLNEKEYKLLYGEYLNKLIMKEEKRIISTLSGVKIKPGRAVGNTSRIVNNAIELLFNNNIIKVEDHYEHGLHRQANNDLFTKILNRLDYEYNVTYLIDNNKIDINKSLLTIELL